MEDDRQAAAELAGMPTVPPPLPPTSPTAPPGAPALVWGPWATVGLGFVIGIGYAAVQTSVVIAFAGWKIAQAPGSKPEVVTRELQTDGLLLAVAAIAACPVCLGLTGLMAKVRKGLAVKDYLAIRQIGGASLLSWLGAAALYAVATDLTNIALGRSVVPEFMHKAYDSAGLTPLLWIALVVAAPISEETLCRGFLFRGLASSRLGVIGAIVTTSLAWAAMHIQYELFDLGAVFVLGLLLGWARHRSGSLYPCLGMHALLNVVATAEAALLK